ncbi:MAG: hypothetical protein R3E99_13110 [Burkholderiaceae bacterium]
MAQLLSVERQREVVQIAMKDFLVMVDALRLQRSWLHSNTCGDVVFAVASFERAVD